MKHEIRLTNYEFQEYKELKRDFNQIVRRTEKQLHHESKWMKLGMFFLGCFLGAITINIFFQ